MDFGLTRDEIDFRSQVREVLRDTRIQAEITRLVACAHVEPDERPLYRMLGERGILAVGWPVEYGGRGLSPVATAIVTEELGRAGVPDTLFVNGIQTVGQLLLLAGSLSAKRRFLPALAHGELFASVLYTEPAAGSDLAAITCAASRVGDGFRITGSKAYNLKSAITDVALCAARTDPSAPRYAGITLFVVDMRAPGVRVDPVPTLADEQFGIVTLDQVEVSDEDVVGGVGDGWATLVQALPLERTGFDFVARAARWLALAGSATSSATSQDAERAGRYAARVEAARLLAWRAALSPTAGTIDPVPASVAKWYSSELAAELAGWALRRHGPDAPADTRAEVDRAYREAPGLLLAGGTSEMMLQTVAEHLPDAVGEGD